MRRCIPKGTVATVLTLYFLAGCAHTPAPPPPQDQDGAGASERLEVRLFAVKDLRMFREQWREADDIPQAQSETVVLQGGTVHLPILFKGRGDASDCELYGRLTITDTEMDQVVYQGDRVKLWTNPVPAAVGAWNMATHVPNVTVQEGGNPMKIDFEVFDDLRRETAHVGLILSTIGTVNDAKR
jgi:hypothetical protein